MNKKINNNQDMEDIGGAACVGLIFILLLLL